MDCEKFDSVTMELLYGELDELSEAAALRHLHHCTRCRDIWGHLRTTRELAEIPLEEPPADLFESVILAERNATKTLPIRERASRVISVLAEYAMRPQLAMAALLLLMIGSSLIFVRTGPTDHGQVSVTELGTPTGEASVRSESGQEPMVFEGERAPTNRSAGAPERAKRVATTEKGTEDKQQASDAETYSEAMAAYQQGRYAEAERLFSEVASRGDERAASAALHEGHAARNGSGCQRAAALYDSVSARFEGGTVSDEASWHAATCYRAMGQLKRASAHYQHLEKRPAYAARAAKALEEIEAQMAVAAKETSKTAGPAETNSEVGDAAGSQATAAAAPTAPTDARPAAPSEPAKDTVPKPAPSPLPSSKDSAL